MSAPTAERIQPSRWVDRAGLVNAGLRPGTAKGFLRVDPVAATVLPFSADELIAARTLTAETLLLAGIKADDRVVVAINNDADLTGAILAEAIAGIAAAVTAPGARGRMRLLKVIEAVRASVLVITPTGLADFLARLHQEFLVDPLDLELRLLVVTGEIGDAKTYAHLAKEFGAELVEVLTDPVTGVPVAVRQPAKTTALTQTRPGLLRRTPIADATAEGLAELAVVHDWHAALRGTGVRTGYLTTAGSDQDALNAPTHTRGDLVLLRGRWLSIAALTKALRGIDGIAHWQLRISRSGTLDRGVLTVSFNRESLVNNGMWRQRIVAAIDALTPVSIEVTINPEVLTEARPPEVVDDRGHHLPGGG